MLKPSIQHKKLNHPTKVWMIKTVTLCPSPRGICGWELIAHFSVKLHGEVSSTASGEFSS